MIQATARVPTSNAEKYVMSLCKQWNQRMEINFRERQGVVHFEDAVATLTPQRDQLVVTILANDRPAMQRLQNVVARSLDQVARKKDQLKFNWHGSSYLELRAL